MQRVLFIVVLSQVALGLPNGSSEIPTDVLQGFFPGRSGNIVLKSEIPEEPRDAEILFLDPSGQFLTASIERSVMSDYSIADVITATVGVQPVHTSGAPKFVKKNMFHRAHANLLLSVESVGSDLVGKHDLSNLQALRERSPVKNKLQYEAYPYDSLAVATSISTGEAPARHGVVGRYWRYENEHITAFSSQNSASYAQTATVADLMSQTFSGNSLTLSVSSDQQLASAFSVNIGLKQPQWNNMCFSRSAQGYSPCNPNLPEDLTASSSSVHQQLLDNTTSVLRLASGSVKAQIGQNSKVEVTYPGSWSGRSEKASFDLQFEPDLHFFYELQYVSSVLESLEKNPHLAALVQDDYPDFVAITLTSMTQLVEKYGRESVEFIGALHLVDALIPRFLDAFSKLYDSNAVSEVVLLGSHSSFVAAADRRHLFQSLHKLMPSEEHLPQFFPQLYVNLSQLVTLCEGLSLQLASLKYRVYCPSSVSGIMTDARVLTRSSKQARAGRVGAPSDAEIELYHITLWTSLGGGFLLYGVIYSLAFMSVRKDPMLYTSLAPDKSEGKKSR